MSIGFIGLGKLGLPCALAMSASTGKDIYGYDINKDVKKYLKNKSVPYVEKDIDEYLNKGNIIFQNSIKDVVINSDIIFIAVQTPHDPEFEGTVPITDKRSDFNYSFLKDVISKVRDSLFEIDKKITLVIICTALPGTIRREVAPILEKVKDKVNLLYNPYFIAMGTTIPDFLNPEFILIGKYDSSNDDILKDLYSSFLKDIPIISTSVESAELAKVSYNTFIGMKIIFSNTLSEITEKVGGNVDEVIDVLSHANKRIISNSYMKAGMGDGGGCHPRDQIAMSWLAKKINLSSDLFEFIAKTRESQTEYYAKIISKYQQDTGLDVVILGEAYKKNVGLTVGSPSILLQHYLSLYNVDFEVIDPFVYPDKKMDKKIAIYFIATQHDVFKKIEIEDESIVIDPWGDALPANKKVTYISLGR